MTQALDEATHRINRYLFLQLVVNSGYGLVIFTALHFIGIPNAALWGVSAAILRFLPYVGPLIAALMPTVLSLAVFPGWHQALAAAGLFLVLELLVGNFVEPVLYGAHIGLSPLAILMAAVFWTLIWGFAGLVLSTPLTVCLVVIGRYVPSLSFLNVLLGDEPVLPPHAHYYQRLLATDQNEARHVLEQYLKEKPLEELYSSVVIPALALAEQDRHRNELDEETQNFIYQSTREIVEELADNPPEERAQRTAENSSELSRSEIEEPGHIDVLCIPARDDADDVVAMMLAQLLERPGAQRTEHSDWHNSGDVVAGGGIKPGSGVYFGSPTIRREPYPCVVHQTADSVTGFAHPSLPVAFRGRRSEGGDSPETDQRARIFHNSAAGPTAHRFSSPDDFARC